MIIPKGTRPEFSLYYIGAKVLDRMRKIDSERDAFELFENIKQVDANYSLNQHLMALNWLYLLGTVSLTPEGRLRLC